MDNEARGQAIKARRLQHGIKSLRRFAAESGVSREGITAAENGTASRETYERLEAWLDAWEMENGAEAEVTPARPLVIRLEDGEHAVVVEGTGRTEEEMTALALQLLERMRRLGD